MLPHSPSLSDRAPLKVGQSDHANSRIQYEVSGVSTAVIKNSDSYLTGASWPTHRGVSLSNSPGI
jgi:hypothetical protein